MNLSKWLVVPFFALSVCLIGCGPDTGTTVIAPEETTEEAIYDADAAYEQQYNEQAASYEAEQ